jgi:hypothetical protein
MAEGSYQVSPSFGGDRPPGVTLGGRGGRLGAVLVERS